MSWDDEDADLISKYRSSPLEGPDPALDQAILRAARRMRLRHRFLPVALAMAASLALLWIAPWHAASPARPRAVPHEVVPGLYDGRVAWELADPAATQQSMAGQTPGGMEGEANHGS